MLDTLPGLPMDQRVEVDITPVEDTTETGEARKDEASARKPARKHERGGRFAEMGIPQEELDTEVDPLIRQARERRKKLEKLQQGAKSNQPDESSSMASFSEMKATREFNPRPHIPPERLEELMQTDPRLENVREARNLRRRLEPKSQGHKIDVARLIREDRDR